MRDIDVIALGELLIDFIQNGETSQGNPLFEANPGGAPCNVLAMLAGLGRKTEFIGKVGRDMFGRQLKEALEDVGIGTTFPQLPVLSPLSGYCLRGGFPPSSCGQ